MMDGEKEVEGLRVRDPRRPSDVMFCHVPASTKQ